MLEEPGTQNLSDIKAKKQLISNYTAAFNEKFASFKCLAEICDNNVSKIISPTPLLDFLNKEEQSFNNNTNEHYKEIE